MPTQQELKQQGNTHFQNNDFKKAIEFYTLAIEQDAFCDEAAPILSNRSLCYYNIGKYKEAYEDAGCCCGIRPDWAKGFARRGFAAEKLGEWQIALESYDEYLKLDKSDEMNIKSKLRNVKKIVDEMEKKKLLREKELQKIDDELSAMPDGTEEKQMKVYSLLHAAASGMDIEKIELAVRHGADLAQRYFHQRPGDQKFSIAAFAEVDSVPDSKSVDRRLANGAAIAVSTLYQYQTEAQDSFLYGVALLAKQRDYLDRLFSLADKQNVKYVPRVKLMEIALHALFSSSNRYPLRKDFFLILNTEKGKKFFVGDTMNMKQWRLFLVQAMVTVASSLTKDISTEVKSAKHCIEPDDVDISNCPTGVHLARILECLEMGLQGATANDLNKKVPYNTKQKDGSSIQIERYLLELALWFAPAPEILDFLLRRGISANIKCCQVGDETVTFSILSLAFESRPWCSKVLLSHGAQINRVPLPPHVINHPIYASSHESSSSVLPLQKDSCPDLDDAIAGLAEAKYANLVGEDDFRTLFDAMTEQNISFISFMKTGAEEGSPLHFYTPLTCAIERQIPVKLIKMMLKVRPKLASTPVPSSTGIGESHHRYPARVVYSSLLRALWENVDRVSAMDESTVYFQEVMTLILDHAGCHVDELPWQRDRHGDTKFLPELSASIATMSTDKLNSLHAARIKMKLTEFKEFCIECGKQAGKA